MSTRHLSGDGRLIGGLALGPRKHRSAAGPIVTLPLPQRLVIPLQEGAAGAADPLVKPGDRVLRGQPLSRPSGPLATAAHASSSGTVAAVERHPVADPRRQDALCVLIDCDGDDTPWPDLQVPDPAQWQPAEQLEAALAAAGIAGLGGAVFPTGRKLARGLQRELRALIVNGAECEPYISCDDRLMRERADEVVHGACAMLDFTGCARALIALEDDKREALRALEAAVTAAGAGERVALVTVPTIYPSGGERQLVQLLTGEEVPSGGFPPDIGYLCQNVGTAAALSRFLRSGEPLYRRVVTVTGGGVASPANLEVRLGTLMSELVCACGGYTDGVSRLIMGGGMTGIALPSDALPVTRATNCVLAATADELALGGEILPCIRCGNCSDVCPAYLMPQLLHWNAVRDNHAELQGLKLFDCIECGCCDVACPSHLPLTQQFREAKHRIRQAEGDRERARLAESRHQAREQRLQRREREREAELDARRAQAHAGDGASDPIAEIMQRVRRRKGGDE